ncbi:HAD family phosphatase [Mycoplasma tauri]|uniref:HAD-IIB family hydrolase n=1 Tax=Mycoplasma tauri TaxID=547987 RepID=UPI0019674483|nr:HAD family hydrolase [Mycoplasma tauri]QSB07732.1 HAD family phosphatase [Mycoplasma tauri]
MSNINDNEMTYFIDLDGTLFDKKIGSCISKKNLSAILLVKNFARILISTGRGSNDQKVKQAIYQLGIKDYICSSGAEIFINNERKYAFFLEESTIDKIINYCQTNKMMFVVFDQNGESIYLNSKVPYWFIKLFFTKKFHEIGLVQKYNKNAHKNIVKIAIVLKNRFKAEKQLNLFLKYFSETCNAYLASNNYIIEVTNAKTNKGIAASIYMQEKNISVSNTIHIGDSDSDVATKGYVGKFVAMMNSTSKAKAFADEIGPNYTRGGLFKYFLKNKKDTNNA